MKCLLFHFAKCHILLLTVSTVWFVSRKKPIHVSSTRQQSCCDELYAQCVDLRKITSCSCSYTKLQELESMHLYVCIYVVFNCTWIYLLATLRSFGGRKVNANKSLSIREGADVAICCWREGKKQTELSKRFCFFSFSFLFNLGRFC